MLRKVLDKVLTFQFIVLILSTLGLLAVLFIGMMAFSGVSFAGFLSDIQEEQELRQIPRTIASSIDDNAEKVSQRAWEALASGTFRWESQGPSSAISGIWLLDPGVGKMFVLTPSGSEIVSCDPNQDWRSIPAATCDGRKPDQPEVRTALASSGEGFHRVELHRMPGPGEPFFSFVETQLGPDFARKRGILFAPAAFHREITRKFLDLFCKGNLGYEFSGPPEDTVPHRLERKPTPSSQDGSGEVRSVQDVLQCGILRGSRVRVSSSFSFSRDFGWLHSAWPRMVAIIIVLAFSIAYFVYTIGAGEAELRLKNDWITNLAHSLRGPLHATGILGDALMTAPDSEREGLKTLLQSQLDHLDGTCRRFIRLAKAGHRRLDVQTAPTPVLPIATKVLDRLRILYPNFSGAGVRLEIPDTLEVQADGETLGQVLETALDNAMKYSPRGALITIAGSFSEGMAVLSVQDQGLGVRQADLARIGEPFFRSSGPETEGIAGTGLGIHLASVLCRELGGSYSLSSDGPGKGCLVRIHLRAATR